MSNCTARGSVAQGAAAVGLLLAIALASGGCGVRGSLESPDKSGVSKQSATADSGQGKKEDAAPKPHKDSFLDVLIR